MTVTPRNMPARQRLSVPRPQVLEPQTPYEGSDNNVYCRKTGKIRLENQDAAMAAFRSVDKRRRKQGLNPYKCRGPGNCGGYHLGRELTRPRKSWTG